MPWRFLAWLICLALSHAASADDTQAAQRRATSIPAQALSPALRQLANERAFQIIFISADVETIWTQGATGQLTLDEALGQLLRGTRLTYRYLDEQTVTIVRQVDNPDGGQSQELEEVIVTAQKKSERLHDVPVPVTVIRAGTLASRGQVRLQDYFATVPGLSIAGGGAGTVGGTSTIAIRGLVSGGITGPAVGLMIDDVPYGASTGAGLGAAQNPDIDPADLARIEVLRGPQGTLYGAASIGGLIKFVTVDPSTEALSGHVELLGDTVDHGGTGYAARGAINIPLSDHLALRASGMKREDPGYVSNVLTGKTNVNRAQADGGRLSALWRITDAVSVKLTAMTQKLAADGDQVVDILTPSLQSEHGGLTQSRLTNTGGYSLQSQLYSATLSAQLPDFDLVSISGFARNEYAGTQDRTLTLAGLAEQFFGVGGAAAGNYLGTNKVTQELRLTSRGSQRLEWLLGAFFTHEATTTVQTLPALDPATGQEVGLLANFNYPTVFSEQALFADLTLHFSDRFDVQVGGRASRNRQTYNETDSGPLIPLTVGLPDPFVYPTEHTRENAFTYLLTPRWLWSPNLMTYLRFASGYRPGGPNFTALPFDLPTHYSPDKSNNYEAGLKADLLDHTLIVESSLYYIDWYNIQLSLQDPASGLGFFGNGGKARSQGLELSVQARPLAGLDLSLAASCSDARLTQNLPPASNIYGASGDRLPYSPKLSASFSADQDFALGSALTLFAGGTVSYVGDRRGPFAISAQAFRFEYPAYTRLDLRVGARYRAWITTLFVNNTADKRGVVSDVPLGAGHSGLYYIQPRTVGLSMSRDF